MLINYLTRLMLIREAYITFLKAIITIKLFFSKKRLRFILNFVIIFSGWITCEYLLHNMQLFLRRNITSFPLTIYLKEFHDT